MTTRDEIVRYLDDRLRIKDFDDASVNGLQVQGAGEVTKVALVTDAALATYRRAAQEGCQMVLAHHGLIWGGITRVTGRDHEHIKFLLDHDINLYAAHLPLDAHPELGNNAVLAAQLEIAGVERFGKYHGVPLGFMGRLPEVATLSDLVARFHKLLGREPTTLPFGPERIETVGIVSGRGGVLEEAIELGLDCLITGEGKHEEHHLALEGKLNVLYLGHYASETVGVKAVGEDLERRFGIETVFIDVPTAF